jgi:hypothetical protein
VLVSFCVSFAAVWLSIRGAALKQRVEQVLEEHWSSDSGECSKTLLSDRTAKLWSSESGECLKMVMYPLFLENGSYRERVAMQVQSHMTINEIIEVLCEIREELEEQNVVLFLAGEQLDGSRTLSDYGIHEPLTLHWRETRTPPAAPAVFSVIVLAPGAMTFDVLVTSTTTVAELRQLFVGRPNVPARYNLFIAGERMHEDRTLGDYNVNDNSEPISIRPA